MRIIKTCQGIGDSIWVLQKLLSTKEQFRFQIHDGEPRRGKQIFDLLPQIAASCEYVPKLQYKIVNQLNIQRARPLWKNIRDRNFYLSANNWLENGNYLKDFFPDLPMNYYLPYQTQEFTGQIAKDFSKDEKYIGIYGSAYSTTRAWGFWQEREWFELILAMHKQRPKWKFVIIGAQWDLDLGQKLIALLAEAKIPYVNTIGKPLGYVAEVMKVFTYAFYFPSGLAILSATQKGSSPSIMFYPPALLKMQGKWAAPELIESKEFFETQFITPEQTFDWVKNEYKLFEKIN